MCVFIYVNLVNDPGYIPSILSKNALERQLQWSNYVVAITSEALLKDNVTNSDELNKILLDQQVRIMLIKKKLEDKDYSTIIQ